ncbi:DUF1499 domain-containing protein [Planktotalea sp.]|uniref:DUF1499 domain-containing protein n=1 Tax=Planktotalea sp. TaxID=2029877 RepID=UPI003D6B7693
MLFWIILALVIAGVAYVQLAPSDATRWHARIKRAENFDFKAGAVRVVDAELTALDKIIRASGTKVLAGSVEEGLVTYITRTRFIRFPDYTTVQQLDGKLAIYGRLRFGRSDLGVNKRRIEGWLAQL